MNEPDIIDAAVKALERKNPERTGKIRDDKGKFLKGVSGNPEGRPKGAVSIVDRIKRKLEEEYPDATNKEKKKYLDIFVEKVFKKAVNDEDVSMMKDIIDRVDGKALQKNEVSGPQGEPLEVSIISKIGEIYGKEDK